jgi:hypothetical protein
MMEPSIPVIQCDDCSKIFLKEKADRVGQYFHSARGIGFDVLEKESAPTEWKRAPQIKAPKENDFYKAIDEGLSENKQEEKNLRLTVWWQSNDCYRSGFSLFGKKKEFLAPEERENNMEKLLGLLDKTNPNEQIIATEILRQLGRFDKAIEELKKLDHDEYGEVIVQLKGFCKNNEATVQKLTFSR